MISGTTTQRVGALITMLLLGLSYASAQESAGRGNETMPVYVEAFENVTGDPADAWIGPGIAASVAADLGGTPAGATGRRQWRVEGAYQRVGETLRITARLVLVPSGQVADSLILDGGVSDLFALQDELARQLAVALERVQAKPVQQVAEGPGRFSTVPSPPASAPTTAAQPSLPVAATTTAGLAIASLSPIDGPA
jgi:TolB-like protein